MFPYLNITTEAPSKVTGSSWMTFANGLEKHDTGSGMADGCGMWPHERKVLFLRENPPSTMLQRFASPEEMASLCVDAASFHANVTAGAALQVEGGIVESNC